MNRNSSTIKFLKYIGSIFIYISISAYVYSMFIVPFQQSQGNWEYVQNVWDRWQGLNVGVLALVSSIIFFKASFYKVEQERKQNFIAARAFLPEVFSELIYYCADSTMKCII